MGDGQKKRQEYGTGGGDIKVGVLVIGIKGMKWGKRNREDRDVAQGEGDHTLAIKPGLPKCTSNRCYHCLL